ncbi:hypothetical protein N7541_006427 [Penicillium brevicompactum]|uniref:Uncharacterized protein n=1 Tax=Penicillium brevicompactum TaxID=5074 RepID=A0A9W9RAH4_PENBR|nr:hypothetical protein N7452_011077 [Penicillium brevicompactum]KAJ5353863.1 hypothetical protein N7541_006427 [Penicillium brevicompactum]
MAKKNRKRMKVPKNRPKTLVTAAAQRPHSDDIWLQYATSIEDWEPPMTSSNVEKTMKQIWEALTAAAAPEGKSGDEYRMDKSVWECSGKVFTNKDVSPFELGFPVGTYRPDDRAEGLAEESRMTSRRLVTMNFSEKTGNKVWSWSINFERLTDCRHMVV